MGDMSVVNVFQDIDVLKDVSARHVAHRGYDYPAQARTANNLSLGPTQW